MRIYYYEYSDDGEEWFVGECSNSLWKVIDKVRECSYPWRIKTNTIDKNTSLDVSQETINETIQVHEILTKIFQ